MPTYETSRRKIIQRLEGEGWVNASGGRHDVFKRDGDHVAVPRHTTISVGVARAIAKAAGW